MYGKLRPAPDRDSAAWWERLARHEFAVQRCDGCQAARFPPRAFCPACRTEGWRWEAVEPEGTVESWIVNHQAFVPGVREPYVVVLVRLAAVPDCLLHGGWAADGEPAYGQAVRGVYADIDDDLVLLNWRPVR
ncbi:Zn-ribbon domain-containing OB-fold protein [Nonomuraea rhizosphaerae]|uniref:Zn-ribbon domain-containing OB-fold protein n=1 Tax=Nonomuraea rhizosphaerae TaxID=2665663 RepID=UPI001C5D8992|nr:zinc ribbon domain-containing protein [Nonomuraea rhizosphaerae]